MATLNQQIQTMLRSFKAQQGREPIPGVDYDPDGALCQDDYEYLTGTGAYSSNTQETPMSTKSTQRKLKDLTVRQERINAAKQKIEEEAKQALDEFLAAHRPDMETATEHDYDFPNCTRYEVRHIGFSVYHGVGITGDDWLSVLSQVLSKHEEGKL